MPAAKPMNAYAPETSHREMPALLRSDDIHHAAKAMIAALASAIALIEGNTNAVRTRSIKPMSGTTMAETRTAEVKFGYSV